MENISKSVRILIKTPNQKVGDQILECLLDWTVNRLKFHISETYPGKPSTEEQKLIYSGRLLHDHLKLKDILRHEDEGPHIFHLVCTRKDSSATSSLATTINDIQDCTQRTPSPSLVTNSEGIRQRTVSQQANQNFSTTLSMPTFPVSPEQVQQMIAMQQMYAYYMTQYLQQAQMVAAPSASLEASAATQAPIGNNVANRNIGAPARPVNENVRMNAQGGPLLDDEEEEFRNRDWLDWFYTFSRALVLFTIVYFYSSPGRFMIVTGIAILAYLYQGGFFGVRQQHGHEDNENPHDQRQNERPNNNEPQLPNRSTSIPPEEQPNQQEDQSDVQNLDNVDDEREHTEQIQDEDNRPFPIVTTAWTFVSSFFSSLIPEQPAPVDIN